MQSAALLVPCCRPYVRLSSYDIVEPAWRDAVLRKLSTKVQHTHITSHCTCLRQGNLRIFVRLSPSRSMAAARASTASHERGLARTGVQRVVDGMLCTTSVSHMLACPCSTGSVAREGFASPCSCLARNTECDERCGCQGSGKAPNSGREPAPCPSTPRILVALQGIASTALSHSATPCNWAWTLLRWTAGAWTVMCDVTSWTVGSRF